jgi:polysaccharide export outer membrane protein
MEPNALIVNLLLVVLLQQTPPQGRTTVVAPTPPRPNAAELPDEYRIGPEDVLAIFVWQNAELTRTVPVRPDGRISLPLVNDVVVMGLTPSQVRQALLDRYREFDKAIELSVMVQEINNFKVTLLGKVGKPGRYRLKATTTVLELVGEAGGLAEYADQENIIVMRPEPMAGGKGTNRYRRIKFNYKRVLQAGGETDNFALQPNDIVIVN